MEHLPGLVGRSLLMAPRGTCLVPASDVIHSAVSLFCNNGGTYHASGLFLVSF